MRAAVNQGKQSVNVIVTVLEVVVPIFAVAYIGFGWVKLGYDYPQAFITRLSMLPMPCLVFVTLPGRSFHQRRWARFCWLLSWLMWPSASPWLCCAGSWVCARNLSGAADLRQYGQSGVCAGFVRVRPARAGGGDCHICGPAVGSFTHVGPVRGGRGARALEPIVLSCFLGAAFLLTGWDLPPIAVRTLDLVGQPAIPLMLLTLGAAVSRLAVRDLARPLVLSLLKLVICAAAAIAVARGFGLGQLAQECWCCR